jgi:hypothetical protein
LDENRKEAKKVREDLRNHVNTLNKLDKARVSDAKVKSDYFNDLVNEQEREISKIHDDAYTSSKFSSEYEDRINESAIRKSMFSVTKSENSASIMGTNVNDEEEQTVEAVKGLTKDISQLRDNRFELMGLKQSKDKDKNQKGSLIDDYADVSTEMPDYTGGDD